METKIYPYGRDSLNPGLSYRTDVYGPPLLDPPNQFDTYRYQNSITQPAKQTDPPASFTVQHEYMVVDSSFRDVTMYPNPNSFVFTPLNPITNILSAEVTGCTVPNITGINQFPYIVVAIQEMNHITIGPNESCAFALLNFFPSNGAFLTGDKRVTERFVYEPRPYKKRLDKLTVSYLQPNGDLLPFPPDSGGVAVPANQNMISIKFTKRIPNNNDLFRNDFATIDVSSPVIYPAYTNRNN